MNLKQNNVEQSSSPPIDSNEYIIDDEFKDLSLSGYINPRDPNEVHSSPNQIGESVAEIAGFNKEKLLEISPFYKKSYASNDKELG